MPHHGPQASEETIAPTTETSDYESEPNCATRTNSAAGKKFKMVINDREFVSELGETQEEFRNRVFAAIVKK